MNLLNGESKEKEKKWTEFSGELFGIHKFHENGRWDNVRCQGNTEKLRNDKYEVYERWVPKREVGGGRGEVRGLLSKPNGLEWINIPKVDWISDQKMKTLWWKALSVFSHQRKPILETFKWNIIENSNISMGLKRISTSPHRHSPWMGQQQRSNVYTICHVHDLIIIQFVVFRWNCGCVKHLAVVRLDNTMWLE